MPVQSLAKRTLHFSDGTIVEPGSVIEMSDDDFFDCEALGWVERVPTVEYAGMNDDPDGKVAAKLYQRLIEWGEMSYEEADAKLDDAVFDPAAQAIFHSDGTMTTMRELRERVLRVQQLRGIKQRWAKARSYRVS